MLVRELIAQLVAEDDMASSVYVRVMGADGKIEFIAVEGIAIASNAYKPMDSVVCTTLLLDI